MAVDPSKNIPTATSTDHQWISWHGQLKKVFGKKQANDVFLYAWSKRGSTDSKANTNALSNYAEKNGFDIERSTLSNIGEGISDFAGGFGSVMKWVWIGSLSIVGLILFRTLWKLTNDPNKTMGQAIALHPAGRGAKAVKGAGAVKSLK